ncbi:hypothetical protein [Pseudomonas sp. UM16]|uniref:hypothetical protein n=1 Tax=Pseudomonas sp. UM16 TaxID=3158962 RepID=UPI00398F99FC
MINLVSYFEIAAVVIALLVDVVAIHVYRAYRPQAKGSLDTCPVLSPNAGKITHHPGGSHGKGGAMDKVKDAAIQHERMRTLEEDEADCHRLGLLHRFMHISALSPSTRTSHAARHGWLYTADDIKHWMVKDDNAIGCQCAFSLVLVDENGKPRNSSLLVRAAVARQNYFSGRERNNHAPSAPDFEDSSGLGFENRHFSGNGDHA